MFWIISINMMYAVAHMLFAKPMIHIVHIFCSLYMKWRPWIACKVDTEALWCVSSEWWNRQLSANQSPWQCDWQPGSPVIKWGQWFRAFSFSSSSKIETCCILNRMHVVKSCLIEGFEFKGFPFCPLRKWVCNSAMFVYVCMYVL